MPREAFVIDHGLSTMNHEPWTMAHISWFILHELPCTASCSWDRIHDSSFIIHYSLSSTSAHGSLFMVRHPLPATHGLWTIGYWPFDSRRYSLTIHPYWFTTKHQAWMLITHRFRSSWIVCCWSLLVHHFPLFVNAKPWCSFQTSWTILRHSAHSLFTIENMFIHQSSSII